MPQKLAIVPSPKQNHQPLAPVPAVIPTPPLCAEDGNIISKLYVPEHSFEALPFASIEPEIIIAKQQPSYSSAVQTPPKRAATPDLDSSGSTASTDESEDSVAVFRRSPTISKSTRLVNPNLVSRASKL